MRGPEVGAGPGAGLLLAGLLLGAVSCSTADDASPPAPTTPVAAPTPAPSAPGPPTVLPRPPTVLPIPPTVLRSLSPSPNVVQGGDGTFTVVPGASGSSGPGPVTLYTVELEGGLGIDPADVARQVETTLRDPRSWGGDGRLGLRRVDASVPDSQLAFRVSLASPDTTDRLCAPLRTNGRFSCASGSRAVLNARRWLTGVPDYAGHLEQYRQYMVNHEVGHTFGRGHQLCPGPGRPAPVMQQQSKGLDGCARNSWPFPART